MNKRISQREARLLRKRVAQLEGELQRQRCAFSRECPGGTYISAHNFGNQEHCVLVAAKTARKLGHAVVATVDGAQLTLYALPLPKQ